MSNPRYAIKVALRSLLLADIRWLSMVSGRSVASVRSYTAEPLRDRELAFALEDARSQLTQQPAGAEFFARKVLLQYAAIRALRPKIMVETGVANGVSTTYFLRALKRNGAGFLHSIDVGDKEFVPKKRTVGWIVPSAWRDQWECHIGDSLTLLPGLLEKLPSLDLFVHDSLHTYHQMMTEFNLAYPHLKRGGLLIADDAAWNSAYKEFVAAVQPEHSALMRGVGYILK